METGKLTREQCEEMILQKLKEIDEIHRQYNPEAAYLSMAIHSREQAFGANNRYYSDDEEYPIDFYEIEEDDDGTR